MSTVILACTASAWCPLSNSSTNYHGAAYYEMEGGSSQSLYSYLLLKFESLPQQYQYNDVISARFVLPIQKSLTYDVPIAVRTLQDDFDASTVTRQTMPGTVYFSGTTSVTRGSGSDTVSYYASMDGTTSTWGEAAEKALRAPGFAVCCTGPISSSGYIRMFTEAASSGSRPYLEITILDSPRTVKTTLDNPKFSEINCDAENEFSWSYAFALENHHSMADIVQSSAKIYWRVSGSSGAYTAINVSGSDPSATIPANTFPAKDIEWYVDPVIVGYTGQASVSRIAYVRRFIDMAANGIATVSTGNPDVTGEWLGTGGVYRASSNIGGPTYYTNLLAEFNSLPSSYLYKAVAKSGITVKSHIDAGTFQGAFLYFLLQGFNPDTVTWNNKPQSSAKRGAGSYNNQGSESIAFIDELLIEAYYSESGFISTTTKERSQYACEALRIPAFMLEAITQDPQPDGRRGYGIFHISDPVFFRAMLLDDTVTSKPEAVTNGSGYVNPHIAQTFRWQHVPNGDYYCVGSWSTVSATLYWSDDDGSTWNSVVATANTSEVTIAAETLTSGTILWKVTATDDKGTTATSDVYTINTVDGAHVATPITPNGSLENGDASIRFIWSDASETGAAPGGADLQYSEDGETWTDFAQPRTSATQYDVPGDTLPSGMLSWRVRSINADGVAGDWSAPLSFLCFASPDAPIVTADGKPLLTVTWQSVEQQAYEVILDGVTYGPYFGSGRSFQAPEYLSDGQHSVSVRVQNEYGLWSDPGTASVTVINQPGTPITLRGIFGRDAELSWTTNNDIGNYLVYRDDVRIGRTGSKSFTDRTCLGYHAWKVIAVLPDGYYTTSNIVNGELAVGLLTIAALSGGSWLELAKSANSDRSVSWSQNQNVSLRQFAGQEYPQAEISPHRSMSASFDVAWRYDEADEASTFNDMIGRAVILKTPCEGVLVGILAGWQRDNTQFFKAYTCTVQRIHWRDYTDADN